MTDPVQTVTAPAMVQAPVAPPVTMTTPTPRPAPPVTGSVTPAPKAVDPAVKVAPPLTAEQLVKRRKDSFALAQAQAKERADLAKKQADARKAVKEPDGSKDGHVLAKLTLDQTEERRVLADKHREARLKVDPTGRVVFSGLDMASKVSELAADLVGPAADLDFVVAEPSEFGLDLEVFDPMTGVVVTAAQGARRNLGQPAILLTADAVVAEVVAARTHQQSAL
jgi:hypothetical protein